MKLFGRNTRYGYAGQNTRIETALQPLARIVSRFQKSWCAIFAAARKPAPGLDLQTPRGCMPDPLEWHLVHCGHDTPCCDAISTFRNAIAMQQPISDRKKCTSGRLEDTREQMLSGAVSRLRIFSVPGARFGCGELRRVRPPAARCDCGCTSLPAESPGTPLRLHVPGWPSR